MCDSKHPFVLDKKYFVNRGPNIDLKTIGAKWKDAKDPEKDIVELAESGLLESHTREDTQRFPTVRSALAASLSMKEDYYKGYYREGCAFSVAFCLGQWICRTILPSDALSSTLEQELAIEEWCEINRSKYES